MKGLINHKLPSLRLKKRSPSLLFSLSGNDVALDVAGRIEKLEERFDDLHQRTLSEVTKSDGVPVVNFFRALTMLPLAFKSQYECEIHSTMEEMLPDETEGSKSLSSIVTPKLFLQFSPLFVFIDYNLLKHIISKFGSATLKSDMNLYVKDMKVFMSETTVADLIEHWPGHEEPDLSQKYSKLIMKFKDDPQKYTLLYTRGYRPMSTTNL